MKFREDLVTNSSSSSFIVSSKEDLHIPDIYKSVINQVKTSDDIIACLVEIIEPWNDFFANEDNLKEQYQFTHEQLNVLKAICLEELPLFEKMMKELNDNKHIYHVCVDRDWIYGERQLQDFLDSCETIDFRTDL